MGTWGIKTFDNDGTLDWLWELEESDDLSVLRQALELEETEYLDASDGEIIVAAAEVVNAMTNGPRDGMPEEALEWIANHSTLDAVPLGKQAVRMLDRVLAERSELKELWAENEEDYPLWLAEVTDLRARLSGG